MVTQLKHVARAKKPCRPRTTDHDKFAVKIGIVDLQLIIRLYTTRTATGREPGPTDAIGLVWVIYSAADDDKWHEHKSFIFAQGTIGAIAQDFSYRQNLLDTLLVIGAPPEYDTLFPIPRF